MRPHQWIEKRPKLNNSSFMFSFFLSCCVTISPTNAFSFPLSWDCESTDVFLTIHTPSLHHAKHSKDSPDENVPWHSLLLSVVLGFFSLLFYLFLAFSQTASHPIHNSPCGDRNLVFVVGLSHRAADVVPLASLNSPTSLSPPLLWVNGVTSNTKPTMWMRTCKWILKESHWTKWPIVIQHIQTICCQERKTLPKNAELPEKELHDAPRILHYNMWFNTKLCAHDLEWAQRGGDTLNLPDGVQKSSPITTATRSGSDTSAIPRSSWNESPLCVQQIVTSPRREEKPLRIPLPKHNTKRTTYPKNTNTKYNE